MLRKVNHFFSSNRKLIPVISTALLAFAAYGIGAYFFVGMRNPQVFLNLFRNSSYLLISGIGMTFVILSGGIDLSVSGVIALTTVASAVLLTGRDECLGRHSVDVVNGDVFGCNHGSFHRKTESAAIYCNLSGHVVCPWDVLFY